VLCACTLAHRCQCLENQGKGTAETALRALGWHPHEVARDEHAGASLARLAVHGHDIARVQVQVLVHALTKGQNHVELQEGSGQGKGG
jgi:hypothetical protein